jgi:hypothetical protein
LLCCCCGAALDVVPNAPNPVPKPELVCGAVLVAPNPNPPNPVPAPPVAPALNPFDVFPKTPAPGAAKELLVGPNITVRAGVGTRDCATPAEDGGDGGWDEATEE